MNQNIASFETLIYKLEGLFEMGGHLVGRQVESIDSFMCDLIFFGICDAQHGCSCEN